MPGSAVSLLLHHVRHLAGAGAPDDRLLADFLARRDEEAFAALVRRHGPMVLNLCRRILCDTHAAEDVFQATFLVLASRAAAIRRRASLASWLHGVAYRLAVRAKRRQGRARPIGDITIGEKSEEAGPDNLAWQEMLGILDEELTRLSERHRAPLVLCYLDGRTQDEAARLLGWSLGTFRRRLERGRDLLQARLRGRGVSLPAALCGQLAAGTAAVPAPLQAATVAAARAAFATMAPEGWTMLLPASMKQIAAMTVACGLALGLGLWAYETRRPAQAVPEAAAVAPDEVFQRAAEAVDACGPAAMNAHLLLELAVQEAHRGHPANARKRFAQAADRFAETSGHARGIL
jgi:RNA polymerase sigma-70 factor (ECF subfamily)